MEFQEAQDWETQKIRTKTLNFYYNRNSQLDNINFEAELKFMKENRVDGVYFVIPDIRILMSNPRQWRDFIKRRTLFQLRNSYIITYHSVFSLDQISRLFNNYADVLRYSTNDLLDLIDGNDIDRLTLKFYLNNVLNMADPLLRDMKRNEDDFEYYGDLDSMSYFYINELRRIEDELLEAINARRIKNVY